MTPMSDDTRTPVIVDALRTPMGRFGGQLAPVRPDDLAAHVVRRIAERNPAAMEQLEDVYFGAANQAGEDNRNVARMASLLAGLPVETPGVTVNRLCGSGMEAVLQAAKSVAAGEGRVYIAGGVESMSRAPLVVPKATKAFPRGAEIFDTALGWRMINPRMNALYPVETLGMTAENVAERYDVSRTDQDAWALRSHEQAAKAQDEGWFDDEITSIEVPQGRKQNPIRVTQDEGVPTRYIPRKARQAQACLQGRRNRHGRQCITLKRWFGGTADHVACASQRAQRRTLGSDRRLGSRGCRPSGDGNRAYPRHSKSAQTGGYHRIHRRNGGAQ